MITHGKAEIFCPKVLVTQQTCDLTQTKPTRIDVALSTPQWKAVMDLEHEALMRNETCALFLTPHQLNVVCNKWIICIKHNVDGSIQRYKARLVAKGFNQTPGIDFFERFSPVFKASTI